MPEYLHTDEQLDVLISLKEFGRQIERVERDPHSWKFAITSLSFAVNGALVCFLSGTMQTGALEEKNAEAAIAALQHDCTESFPKLFLATPEKLLARATGKNKRFDTRDEILKVAEAEKSSFKRMIDFRNQLTHFSPQDWSIELGGLPGLCVDCLSIVNSIRLEGWAFRHLDDLDRDELEGTLEALSQQLVALDKRSF
jgi:hypothetical protein